ncbi:restriction endonuclease subunit S [Methanocella arvoryzae]|uniref:Type I restriction modification system,specificity subunit n=1 Tax=Methanocella arvoryzae (strain DSM 22066 / NBRC 105507 / MRE50) TaxID=351160 RepID=Q0W4T6_METAR|nr:restriction endonuclease subunit S [Methanocella arvoryzae]CAJ36607.1 type I restriction modification system,specificity subunit [Methanocella arvoryzae MRE50]
MIEKNELPTGWCSTDLGDIISPSKEKIEPVKTESIPYIGLEHIEKDTGKLLSFGNSTEVTSTKTVFHKGDLLYGKLRPYLNKVCVTEIDGICSTDILVFNEQRFLSNKLLKYRMLCPDFVRYANQNATGVNHPRVDFKKIASFEIALPPLAEQHRIVAKIEELFTQLDAGVEALKKAKEQIKQYRQAVLESAFNGKLTEKWRLSSKEYIAPISEFISNVQKTRSTDGKTVCDQLESTLEMPNGWLGVLLYQIADIGTGATPLRSNKNYYENGTIPWITSSAVNSQYITKADEFITELAIKETNAKIFPKNSLIIALYGEGKTRGKVSELLIEAATNQACAAIIFNDQTVVLKPFIKLYFQKNYEDLRKLASGGVQPNLNLGIIKSTLIPLPPLAEQEIIVGEIEKKFPIMEDIEKTIDQSLSYSETLRQSILSQAFSGKLVPQNPNDEPAEKLLERIRAERLNQAAGKPQNSGPRRTRKQATLA